MLDDIRALDSGSGLPGKVLEAYLRSTPNLMHDAAALALKLQYDKETA